MVTYQRIISPLLVSVLFTVLIFGIHMMPNINSILNNFDTKIDTYILLDNITYHQTEPTFAKRIFTTESLSFLNHFFGVHKAKAFIIVNFLAIALNGFLVYLLSLTISNNVKKSIFNMLVFFLCFSNLFPFFEPIYTYDEPIQFFFILLSLIMLVKKKLGFFSVFFFLSVCARESSLILLPSVILLWRNNSSQNERKDLIKPIVWFGMPIILYSFYSLFIISHYQITSNVQLNILSRFEAIKNNFQSWTTGFEAVFSFFLIFSWPLYWLHRIRKHHIRSFVRYLGWIQAFYLTLILNTLVVYFFTNAGEVRLFVLPLFFLWPIFSNLFRTEFNLLKSANIIFNSRKAIISLILLTALNYLISIEIYKTTISFTNYNYFNEYSFLLFLFLTFHFSLSIAIGEKQKQRII